MRFIEGISHITNKNKIRFTLNGNYLLSTQLYGKTSFDPITSYSFVDWIYWLERRKLKI